ITVVGVEEFRAADALGHMPDHTRVKREIEPAKFGIEKYLGKLVVKASNVKSVSLVGHTAEAIVDYADEQDISLIVMATHGRSGIKRWALGSVADKVLRGTKKPVILIRAKADHPDVREEGILKKILMPLDGSTESETVIPYVEQLASKLKAEVILFQTVEQPYHVVTAAETFTKIPFNDEEVKPILANILKYLANMSEAFGGKGIVTRSEVRIGDAGEEIITFADEINADLVAMSTHGRSGVSRWTFGSVADKVLRRGNTPLLLVRPHSLVKIPKAESP
ncbi:MAG: universal stress protein, partial [Chloroflexota bacterium]|nr:universal stress protein [Chloroflexota bacterium]